MITIVTYGDFGRYRNLKSEDIIPVIETFEEKKIPTKVISRLGSRGEYGFQAVPTLAHYFLGAVGKIFPKFPRRKIEEGIFETRGSGAIGDANIVFFHPARFRKGIRKAKKCGAITVGFATTAHLDFNRELEKEELSILGWSGDVDPLISFSDFELFDYLISLSGFAAKTYIEKGFPKERVFIAEPDIDQERFFIKEGSKRSQFTVVFPAASTGPLKGVQYLLDAWGESQVGNGKLLILGELTGWPVPLKNKILKKIEGNESIQKVGTVSNPEDFFREANVVVYPSLTEGFGRASLEAMACGTPVIVTENAQGIVEDGETGFVLPIRDVEGIKEKLEYLYNHRDKASEMGQRAVEAARNKKPFGEAVYEIYKEICKRENL